MAPVWLSHGVGCGWAGRAGWVRVGSVRPGPDSLRPGRRLGHSPTGGNTLPHGWCRASRNPRAPRGVPRAPTAPDRLSAADPRIGPPDRTLSHMFTILRAMRRGRIRRTSHPDPRPDVVEGRDHDSGRAGCVEARRVSRGIRPRRALPPRRASPSAGGRPGRRAEPLAERNRGAARSRGSVVPQPVPAHPTHEPSR